MHLSTSRRFSIIAGIIALVSLLPLAVFASGGGVISKTASRVWGQPNFTSKTSGTSATQVDFPSDLAFDADGNMYVADYTNNRVLRYPVADGVVSTTADLVWGQADLTSNTYGTSATTLRNPVSITFDADGNMYVADQGNCRIVRFPIANGVIATTADRVWGQANFTGFFGGVSPTMMNQPIRLTFDADGNMYVADQGNSRVLRFPITNGVIATTADRVWGQADLTSNTTGTSATMMNQPTSITFDADGNMYVADASNNRVVRYPITNGVIATTADRVWGQADLTSKTFGTSATTLKQPNDITIDAAGYLYVVELYNHRVLRFPIVSGVIATTADHVVGQPNFTSNTYGTSAILLFSPFGLAFDTANNFYVADPHNKRVLHYPLEYLPTITTQPAAQRVTYGESATLSVAASGKPTPTYQWYAGQSGVTSKPILGGTTASLQTDYLIATTSYWVRVTNAAGSVDSNTVRVTVSPIVADYVDTADTFRIRNFTPDPIMVYYTTTSNESNAKRLEISGTTEAFVPRGEGMLTVRNEYDDVLASSTAGTAALATPTCNNLPATIWAGRPETTRDRTLNIWKMEGTNGADVIIGTSGNDQISAGEGADVVCAGAGNDEVGGGSGNDRLYGGKGDDSLDGHEDVDVLVGGEGKDFMDGGTENDTMHADGSDSDVFGGFGYDTVDGRASTTGLKLNIGYLGIERAYGSNGADEFTASSVPDGATGLLVYGGGGNDTITGSSGADTLYGEGDMDTIRGDGGNDIINGGKDDDTLEGGAGNDRIMGEGGGDTLKGDADDDTLYPDGYDALVVGGTGKDTLNGLYSSIGIMLDLGASGIEIAYGSASADSFASATKPDSQDFVIVYGRGGSDTIYGSPGNDRLYGEGGDDHLYGEDGDDVFDGGSGKDFFSGGAGRDRINAFNATDDTKDNTFP